MLEPTASWMPASQRKMMMGKCKSQCLSKEKKINCEKTEEQVGVFRNNEHLLLLGLELVTMADPPKSQLVEEGFFWK